MRLRLALFAVLALASGAKAQIFTGGSPISAYRYAHISTAATTTVKTGLGILHNICINNPVSTEVISVYDNTSATGTLIAVIDVASGQGTCLSYDVAFTTGLDRRYGISRKRYYRQLLLTVSRDRSTR